MPLVLETWMRRLALAQNLACHDAARRHRLQAPQSVDHAQTWTVWKSAVSPKGDIAIREARTIFRIREGAVLNFKSTWCQDGPSCEKNTSLSLSLKLSISGATVRMQTVCVTRDNPEDIAW